MLAMSQQIGEDVEHFGPQLDGTPRVAQSIELGAQTYSASASRRIPSSV
jgi:hypothetical protein